MYCLNNQEQSFYQVVEANKLLGDFLQQRLGLDCTQDDVEHCWGVLQVSTWLILILILTLVQTNSISLEGGGRGLFPLVSLLSHS